MDRPGSYTTWAWNARNFLNEVRSRNSSDVDLYRAYYYYWSGSTWDHAGNPKKKAEWFLGVPNYYWTYYSYDGVYRLTAESYKHRDDTGWRYQNVYGYDQVGNRITQQETVGGWTRYFTYDDNDKLTQIGTTQGGNDLAIFGYDGAGNTTSAGGSLFGAWTLAYDDESRLTSVTYPSGGGSQTDNYWYNALGQRRRHYFSGVYRRYVYAGERVLEVTNDAGNDVRARYTLAGSSYFAPLVHMWFPTDTSRFPLYDGVGTIRTLSDSTGAVTDTWALNAFGEYLNGSGSSSTKYQYGGAWGYMTDPSGLLQLGARFYWPELGRFVQQDPIGDGMNWYVYAGGNPVGIVDPTGHFCAPIFLDPRKAAEVAAMAAAQREWEQARIDWAISALSTLGYIQEAEQLRGRVNVVAWLPGAVGWTNPVTGNVNIVKSQLYDDNLLLSTLVHEAQHQWDMFVDRRNPSYTHANPNGREDDVINDYADAVKDNLLTPGDEVGPATSGKNGGGGGCRDNTA